MKETTEEIEQQRQYYAETAERYDAMHVNEKDEHFFALSFLVATIEHLQIRSILDIGSGTGRAIGYLRKHNSELRIVGIEPVRELREIGYSRGLSPEDLIDGDAKNLQYEDGAFDLVCEFGVLHHIRNPELAVAEMLRVANKAVFISDSNNFGQGSLPSRLLKQCLNRLGLWKISDFVKTKGKGYSVSEEDGVAYSYSVFNNYRQIRAQCESVHVLNTRGSGINPYKSADHVALLGIKPTRSSN